MKKRVKIQRKRLLHKLGIVKRIGGDFPTVKDEDLLYTHNSSVNNKTITGIEIVKDLSNKFKLSSRQLVKARDDSKKARKSREKQRELLPNEIPEIGSNLESQETDEKWPFSQFCDSLLLNIFHSRWEIRHGCGIGLRIILKCHGLSAGKYCNLDDMKANDLLHEM